MSKRFGRNRRRKLEQKLTWVSQNYADLERARRDLIRQLKNAEEQLAKWRPRTRFQYDYPTGEYAAVVRVHEATLRLSENQEATIDEVLRMLRYQIRDALR